MRQWKLIKSSTFTHFSWRRSSLITRPVYSLSNLQITHLSTSTSPPSYSSSTSVSSSSTSVSSPNSSSPSSSSIKQRAKQPEPTRRIDRWSAEWNRRKRQLRSYFIILASLGSAYVVYDFGLHVTSIMVEYDKYEAPYMGYCYGIVTAGMIWSIYTIATRFLAISPVLSYRRVLKRVLHDPLIQGELGKKLRPGKYRAYSFVPGGLKIRGMKSGEYSGWTRWLRPRKIQLVFDIQGDQGQGLITAEVDTTPDYTDIHYISMYNLVSKNRMLIDGKNRDALLSNSSSHKGAIKLR